MLPYKNEVIQSLELCLDDKKRLVRKEAVKSRSSWYGIRIALKFGGTKLQRINLHANFGRLNFGKTSTT